jgi:ABC-type phosphate/phosphonate transport system substrate-binding protein
MPLRKVIVAVMLLAAAATACGSTSKSASTTTPTTTPGASPGTPTTVGSGTPTTKAFSGSSGSGFCDQARSFASAFKSSSFGTKTPADLKNAFKNLQSELDHAASVAPSAIKGDMQTLAAAYRPILKAFADANYDFTKLSPTALSSFSNPQFAAAAGHIGQYFSQVCHVTPTT